jgi:hypothetical protein
VAVIRRLLGVAALLGAVAGAPQLVSVQSPGTDRVDSGSGVMWGGSLNVKITEVDGREVRPAKRVDLAYGPTSSTFSLSHRLTLRNDDSVPLRGLALSTLPGPADDGVLARLLRVRVQVSVDGFRTSTDMGTVRLSDLQQPTSRPVPLPAVVRKAGGLQIQITFSATGLDNSVAGATVSPTMVFVGSG